jgi:hypothetical protein
VVQVAPIKPTFKTPGTNCSKLEYDEPLSSFAFNFDLRPYTRAMSLLHNHCYITIDGEKSIKVGRCGLMVSRPVLKVVRACGFCA